jgi:DNA-binding response OmpR family regulator
MEELSVLIVDDDASVQNVVGETLGDGGFVSKVASSGEEAAALLIANNYRMMIVDISFGIDRVEGWSIARRARAFNPSLPVIYITGGSGHDWAIQGVPNSILLTKPFAPAQLLSAVSQLLDLDCGERT